MGEPIGAIGVHFVDVFGFSQFWMGFAAMLDERHHINVGLITKGALDREVIDVKHEVVRTFCVTIEILLLAEETGYDA